MTAPLDLQGLRALAEKATPGEWRVYCDEHVDTRGYSVAVDDGPSKGTTVACRMHRCEAEFIAAANPSVVLRLLERLEAAEKVCEAMMTLKPDAKVNRRVVAALSSWCNLERAAK